MKLNPKKCVFGVTILGFLIDERGISANPDKVQAVIDMKAPTRVKEVQKLTLLGSFLSRSGDKCHHFFSTIRKKAKFEWTPEAEENAFGLLKEHLHSLPRLISPLPEETLYVYLTVSDIAVSAVLVAERSGIQIPVYFISHVLQNAEIR